MKESGCFRTQAYAEAYARISSYLQSMAALGHNPLVAIQIALAGHAADTVNHHYGPTRTGACVVAGILWLPPGRGRRDPHHWFDEVTMRVHCVP